MNMGEIMKNMKRTQDGMEYKGNFTLSNYKMKDLGNGKFEMSYEIDFNKEVKIDGDTKKFNVTRKNSGGNYKPSSEKNQYDDLMTNNNQEDITTNIEDLLGEYKDSIENITSFKYHNDNFRFKNIDDIIGEEMKKERVLREKNQHQDIVKLLGTEELVGYSWEDLLDSGELKYRMIKLDDIIYSLDAEKEHFSKDKVVFPDPTDYYDFEWKSNAMNDNWLSTLVVRKSFDSWNPKDWVYLEDSNYSNNIKTELRNKETYKVHKSGFVIRDMGVGYSKLYFGSNYPSEPDHVSTSFGRAKNSKIKGEYKTYMKALVARAFLPNPNNKRTAKNIDGNIFDNHIDNLKWV